MKIIGSLFLSIVLAFPCYAKSVDYAYNEEKKYENLVKNLLEHGYSKETLTGALEKILVDEAHIICWQEIGIGLSMGMISSLILFTSLLGSMGICTRCVKRGIKFFGYTSDLNPQSDGGGDS